MKRRILATVLALCLVLGLVPGTAWAAEIVASGECGAEGDNVTWTLDSNGKLSISGTGQMASYHAFNVHAPWYDKRNLIKSIVVADGVTYVGSEAFADCDNLLRVVLADTVISIGSRAFEFCKNLRDISFPGVCSIGTAAFYDCSGLTSLSFPDSLALVENIAFSGCSGLTELTIPAKTHWIGQEFSRCTGLTSVTFLDGVNYIWGGMFLNCTNLVNVSIPSTVTYISDSVFSGCSKLAHITIPDSVKTIGSGAFRESGLTSITIPDSVTSIGDAAFYDCHALANVTLSNKLTSIADHTFRHCDNLTNIVIPNSVASIGYAAFSGCERLQNIVIPNSVKSIGEYAFAACHSLHDIIIPDGITSIGTSTFYDCAELESVAIPISVTKIDSKAFDNCKSMSTVYYSGTQTQWEQIEIAVYGNEALLNAGLHSGQTPTPPKLYGTDFTMGVDSLPFNNSFDYFNNRTYIDSELYATFLSKLNSREKLLHVLQYMSGLALSEDEFFGACHGIAVVMALIYDGRLSPRLFTAGAKSAFHIDMPQENERVESLIQYYQLMDIFDKPLFSLSSQSTMFRKLVSTLKSGRNVIINSDNHSTLAYALDEDSYKDYYIVYYADPNNLLDLDTKEVSPMYINKFEIRKADYTSKKTLSSIITDLSYYDKFDLTKEISDPATIETIVRIATDAMSFSLEANGKIAQVEESAITGNLSIDGPYYINSGENKSNMKIYYVEDADTYEFTNICYDTAAEHKYTGVFSDAQKYGSIAKSDADRIIFTSDGSVRMSGATGLSSISVTTDSIYDSWYALTATTNTADLTVTPKAVNCSISSTAKLGDIRITGITTWNNLTLNATVDDQNATVSETEKNNRPYLTLTDSDNNILGEVAAIYSVTYMTRGGSSVDAQKNIAYGTKLTVPTPPTYNDYIFDGWYKNSACSPGQEWDFDVDTVTSDTVLYAKWVPQSDSSDSTPDTSYISIPTFPNGTITPTTRNASPGDRVTLYAHPDAGYELDTLTVRDIRGRNITLRSLGDNAYSFLMPAARVTVDASFVKIASNDTPSTTPAENEPFTGLGTPGISGIVLNPAVMPFTDVKSTDWFYNNVDYVWKHYLMSGVSDTQFAPNVTTSRAMIWTILARMNNVRTDINPGSTWYEKGLLWAQEQGVTDGTNPMSDITREQLAAMLWRNAGRPAPGAAADLSRFSDSDTVSEYAQTAVRWAASVGILNGSDGKIDPQGTATRAQVAAMVNRYGEKIGK